MPRPSLISSDGNGCAEQTFLPGVTLRGSPPRDSAAPMAELDGVKEELVYLRLWLGIMVVAEIGLLGWLAAAPETTTPRLFALGVGGMIVLGMSL
jgi:hypothetical protein